MSLLNSRLPVDFASALRAIYGQNPAKKIARRYGVSLTTAQRWLSGQVKGAARDRRIAQLYLDLMLHQAECARIERWCETRFGGKECVACDGPSPGSSMRSGSPPPASGRAPAQG